MVVEPVLPASKVYDQGLAKLANGDPGEAAKKFTDLGKKYPGSDWARKGLLMTTYAQYQSGDYDDAAGSAMRYVKEYPKSPEAPYALYLQAQQPLRADPRHLPRSGPRRQGAGAVQGSSCRPIRTPNMSPTRKPRSR